MKKKNQKINQDVTIRCIMGPAEPMLLSAKLRILKSLIEKLNTTIPDQGGRVDKEKEHGKCKQSFANRTSRK